MTIDELEQILPPVAENDFSWEELLQSRFREFGVDAYSVGQWIYDLLKRKDLPSRQNEALRREYDEMGQILRDGYKRRKWSRLPG